MADRRLTRRKLLINALTASPLLLLLAGCSSGATTPIADSKPAATAKPSEPTKAAAPTTAASTPKPAAANQPAKPAPGELRFIKLAMSDPVKSYFEKQAIPEFEAANPGLKVKVDMSDWDHLGEKLLTSFAGNVPIDLVETGSDWVGPYAARQQFLPLDDFIAKDYASEMPDFYTDMVDISRYKSKLMGLPYVLDIRTMCYRKDHFTEVGLDPEKPPTTWDDLVEYGKKLAQVDAQGRFIRSGYLLDIGRPASAFFEYWYLLVQNGADVITPMSSWDPADVKFNGPEGVEALQFMYDLVHTHKITPMTGVTSKTQNLSPLADGVTSMSTNNAGMVGNWKQYQPDKIELLGIGVPLKNKKQLQYACPNVYAIGTNTKRPDEAWLLMKHMVSRETLTGMLEPDSAAPPRKSIAAEAPYMKDPMLTKFQAVVEQGWGTTTPQATDFPTLEIIGNYVQAAFRDEMKVKDALDKAAEEVKKKVAEAAQAAQ